MTNLLIKCVQNRKKMGLSLKDCFTIPCVLCPVVNCEAERGQNESQISVG